MQKNFTWCFLDQPVSRWPPSWLQTHKWPQMRSAEESPSWPTESWTNDCCLKSVSLQLACYAALDNWYTHTHTQPTQTNFLFFPLKWTLFFFPIPSKEIWLPVLLSVNWCYVHPFSLFCNSNSAPKSQLLLPTPMLLWPTYAGSSKAAKKTHLCPLQVGPLPMAFAKGLYLPLPVGSSLCQLFDDAILHLLLITGPTAATLHLSVQTSSCKEESYPPAKYWQSASSLDVLFH